MGSGIHINVDICAEFYSRICVENDEPYPCIGILRIDGNCSIHANPHPNVSDVMGLLTYYPLNLAHNSFGEVWAVTGHNKNRDCRFDGRSAISLGNI